MKEKPTVGPPFFWAFPSDRIPKRTKNVNVHFFINNSNSCKLYHEFWKHFEPTAYVTLFFDITLLSCLDKSCVYDILKFGSLIRGVLGTFHRNFSTRVCVPVRSIKTLRETGKIIFNRV